MSSDCKSKVEMLFSRYTDEQILEFVGWVIGQACETVTDELICNELIEFQQAIEFFRSDVSE